MIQSKNEDDEEPPKPGPKEFFMAFTVLGSQSQRDEIFFESSGRTKSKNLFPHRARYSVKWKPMVPLLSDLVPLFHGTRDEILAVI